MLNINFCLVMKRFRFPMGLFLLLMYVAFFAECSLAAGEKSKPEISIPKEKNGIFYFEHPENHRVTAIQYQLHGRIKNLKKNDKGILFQFEGGVDLLLTGAELFNSKGRHQAVHWDVVRLPVEIASWKRTSFPWFGNSLNFDETFKVLSLLAERGDLIDAAVKDIKLVIGGTGDLLRIEGGEILSGKPTGVRALDIR